MADKKQSDATHQRLYRSGKNRYIAGVAGGLGEYFNIDPTIIRIIFVIIALFGGSGILLYLLLWMIMPPAEGTTTFSVANFKSEIKESIYSLKTHPEFKNQQNSRFWWGLFILVTGVLILFNNIGLLDNIDFGKYWPILLVIAGFMIIFNNI